MSHFAFDPKIATDKGATILHLACRENNVLVWFRVQIRYDS